MSTTLTRSRSEPQSSVETLRFRGNGLRRKPAVAIASLALVTCCVAIFTSVYLHAGNRVAVLALARDVPQGHAITSGDLAVVRLSFSADLSPVSADDANRVIGRTAAVSLLRGTLISLTELAGHGGLPHGQAVVGIATNVGQLPAGGVTDGDTVDVILTGSPATLTGGATDGPASSTSATGPELEIGGVLAPNATVTGVAPRPRRARIRPWCRS